MVSWRTGITALAAPSLQEAYAPPQKGPGRLASSTSLCECRRVGSCFQLSLPVNSCALGERPNRARNSTSIDSGATGTGSLSTLVFWFFEATLSRVSSAQYLTCLLTLSPLASGATPAYLGQLSIRSRICAANGQHKADARIMPANYTLQATGIKPPCCIPARRGYKEQTVS